MIAVKDMTTPESCDECRFNDGMTYYTYGMRLRPAGPGCQPKDIAVICSGNRRYHNILMYSRKLTEEEERSYELDYLGEQALGDKIDGRTE